MTTRSVIRRTLTHVLNEDPEIDVVGAAADGRMALDCLPQLTPDVVLLDIDMPNMNGFETLQVLRKERPHLPVIMFSSLTERGAAATLDALMLGANDYVPKPANVNSFEVAQQCIRDEVIPRIKQFARIAEGRAARPVADSFELPHPRRAGRAARVEVLVIGVSTGGPAALARLLPTFVRDCPVPIVIVQHMPPMFTRHLAERLAAAGHLCVREGRDGQVLRGGEVCDRARRVSHGPVAQRYPAADADLLRIPRRTRVDRRPMCCFARRRQSAAPVRWPSY